MTEEHAVTQTISLKESIVQALQNKKAKNVVTLDLRDLEMAPVDAYVICHGTSDRQVEALARAVEEAVEKESGEKPWHREGFENKEWILLDYVDVVVHIFQKDKREFYGLEDLWADAPREEFEDQE